MDIITTDISINEKALDYKIDNIITDDVMLEIHNLFAKTIDPWTPFFEGPLSQTVEITPNYIRYIQPYSHYQYVGTNFKHTTEYHPLATAYWDRAAMQTQLPLFEKQVTDILKRRAKELYG